MASLILFQGLNTSGGVNTLSLICGFITTFLGVYLLNLSRSIASPSEPSGPPGRHHRRISHTVLETGIFNPRISISSDRHNRGSFESVPTEDDEAFPLRNKGLNGGTRTPGGGRRSSSQVHSPISSYNHQHGASMNGHAGAYSSVSDGRKPSPSEVVFDIGDDEDTPRR